MRMFEKMFNVFQKSNWSINEVICRQKYTMYWEIVILFFFISENNILIKRVN